VRAVRCILVCIVWLAACGERPAIDAGVMGEPVVDAGTDVSDAGTFDAGPIVPDAGLTPVDAGAPDASVDTSRIISAPARTWTFVDVPQSRCANGSTTGFAANLTETSTDLFVYFVGGGACWNLATCGTGTSANIRKGYSADDFRGDGIKSWAIFNRDEPRNPFRDMSFIIVPYCTADVHAGNRVTSYGGVATIQHAGARNVAAMMPRLTATFTAPRRVVVAGSSAGGFGAQLNFPAFAAAFPTAAHTVIADSAQLVNPVGGLVDEWVTSWGVAVPPACVGCQRDFPRYLTFVLQTYPQARFGLLASMRDVTLTPFFGFGINVQGYADASSSVLDQYESAPNGSFYARAGARHTWLEGVRDVTRGDDAFSIDWVSEFIGGAVDRRRP
jgi:hypothetical protein